MGNIFISYARADGAVQADALANDLRAIGHQVFKDTQTIPAGVEFEQQLKQGLRSTDVIIILNTPESIKSQWVYREFELARNFGKAILPVRIDNSLLAPYLHPYQAFKIEGGDTHRVVFEVDRLLRKLALQKTIRRVLAAVVILIVIVVAFLVVNRLTAPPAVASVATFTPTDTATLTRMPSVTPTRTPSPTATATRPPTETRTSSSLPTPVISGPLLLIENFDDASVPTTWSIDTGNWVIVSELGNPVFRPIDTFNVIKFGDVSWHNYQIDFNFKLLDRSKQRNVWVDVRVSDDERSLVVVQFDFTDNKIRIASINRSGAELLGEADFMFKENEWYQIQIQNADRLVKVVVNGLSRIFRTLDDASKFGAIRLRSSEGFVLFDNVMVSALADQ